jgi:YVTN family beta-propeller protein
MAELALGSTIADCELEEIIGRGGMGVVYKARQISLDRVVALKAIAPELSGDEEFRERFKRESRIAASIEHPNVIPVYQAGESDGLLYLTMRYVEGIDLRTLIDDEGPLEPSRAARVVAQVAAALAAAHGRGLVHRDVKPGNVLIDRPAELEHIYLTDFGIARHLASTKALTKTGAVVGTMDYLAPEQVQGLGADARSDVYSLGCVLFETLTGRVPFPRDNEAAKMFAHMSAPVPSTTEVRPEVPGPLDKMAVMAMAKEPEQRFQSATEFAEGLLAHAGTGRAPPLPPPAHPGPVAPIVDVPAGEAATGPPPTEAAAPPTEAAVPPTEAAVPPTEAAVPPTEAAVPPTRRAAPPAEAAPPGAPAAEPSGAEVGATRAAAPPKPARRRRVPVVVGGVAAAAVVAAVAVIALSGGGETSDQGAEPADGGQPLAPRALASVQLGRGNDGVAAGGGSVYVTDRFEAAMRRLNPSSRRVVGTIRVGKNPDSVAIGEGSVWVTNTDDNTISRVDPATSKQTAVASVGAGPEGLAVGGGAVWSANTAGNSVTRIDPTSNRAVDLRAGRKPIQIAVAEGTAWVTAEADGTVVPLKASNGARDGDPIPVGGAPRGIAFASGAVWVAASKAAEVVVVDTSSRRVIARIPVGDNPREVRAGLGAVWVTVAGAGEVVAIDPSSRKVAARVPINGEPFGLAVGEGRVWASNLDGGLLTPIDPQGG